MKGGLAADGFGLGNGKTFTDDRERCKLREGVTRQFLPHQPPIPHDS
jgi:hypothetical protein